MAAGKQLKDFPDAAPIGDADLLYGAQSGAEKRMTRGALVAQLSFPTFAAMQAALTAGAFTLPRKVLVMVDETFNSIPTEYTIDANGHGYQVASIQRF
ncbi:hypothetical protein [Cupriavidus basilensis]|uniref:Uncharacterized protein n=1 Tax=Cupriavidus basilensis TaxID=68895 RepID=A0A0C4Y1W2_9BURK|nr:hypothetical protein [Cupriavidus basilensis]AJG19087.1 hypothetical protein RR42_m1690 [Cupriavidus basilensis]